MSDNTSDPTNHNVRVFLRDRLHGYLLSQDGTSAPDLDVMKTLLQIVDSADKTTITMRRIKNEEKATQTDAQYKATLARLLLDDSALPPKQNDSGIVTELPDSIQCPPLVEGELSNDHFQENFDDFHKRLEGDAE